MTSQDYTLLQARCLVILFLLFSFHLVYAERPNVIIIMTDDQGFGDISYHGHPIVETPNMDALAKESVRLTDFHVDAFCAPTRAALLTGRMSAETGVTSTYGLRNFLRRDETSMAEYFQASGYRTGIFGKWHLGGNYPYRPMDRGFDEWLGLGNGGLGLASDLWDNDRMDDRYWHNGEIIEKAGFCTDVYFKSAMEFMSACKKEKTPFFAYIPTNVPHYDNNVPKEWLSPYLEKGCNEIQAAYYASIGRVDRNLGRLMDWLEAESLAENTILVFTTDNGTVIPLRKGSDVDTVSGMRGMKGSMYEGGHRVPCFIRGSQELFGKSRDITELTSHIDLLPTFIDLCELKSPKKTTLPLSGRSLSPLFHGGKWESRTLYLHKQNGAPVLEPEKNGVIITPEWRLILSEPDSYELYNIKKDPSQKKDIANDHPELIEQLLFEYREWWESIRVDRPIERPLLSHKATLRLGDGWQHRIRKGLPGAGKHHLHVAEKGNFRFEVRRWPREAGEVGMCEGLPPNQDPNIEYIGNAGSDIPGVPLEIDKVEFHIKGQEPINQEVLPNAESVDFEMPLGAGDFDFNARFILKNGKHMDAYFVYAEKI